jgi:hypothetical protein
MSPVGSWDGEPDDPHRCRGPHCRRGSRRLLREAEHHGEGLTTHSPPPAKTLIRIQRTILIDRC